MDIMLYLLKVNLVFALLFGVYLLFLRKETFFLANRAWLMGAVILPLVLPLVQWSAPLSPITGGLLPEVPVNVAEGAALPGSDWWTVVLFAYAAGVLLHLLILVKELRAAWLVVRTASSEEAFSFLGNVVLPDGLSVADELALRAHEQAHVRHAHSVDVLLLRSVQAVNWFNPLWGIALKELQLVHEHTADAIASEHHTDYDSLLLAQALGVPSHTITNNFRSSNLKNRMTMIHRRPSSFVAGTKYLLALPLLLAALIITSPLRSASPLQAPQARSPLQAEQMPEFPGGTEAMMKFIASNLKYPEAARKAGQEGKVFIGFVVDKDGAVTKALVKRGVGAEIDAEALRVVNAMPKWKPGTTAGKAVAVEMTLPIVFKLSSDQ